MIEKVMAKNKRGGRRSGAGRRKGIPNKVTTEVRAIFKGIMERNASKVEAWIAAVAKDDPARATELLLRLAEFHLPKLARTEVGGLADTPLVPPAIIVPMKDIPGACAKPARSGESSPAL